jgi:hypothetical protein
MCIKSEQVGVMDRLASNEMQFSTRYISAFIFQTGWKIKANA